MFNSVCARKPMDGCSLYARKGAVLVTVLVTTGVCALVLAGVPGYVSSATRMTALHAGNNICRLAAQGEIELAKAAVNEAFNRANVGAHKIVGGSVGNLGCSFDWFGVGDNTTVTRTIGAQNGRGTAVTLDESAESCGCTVRVRAGRVRHPANTRRRVSLRPTPRSSATCFSANAKL